MRQYDLLTRMSHTEMIGSGTGMIEKCDCCRLFHLLMTDYPLSRQAYHYALFRMDMME